jgi:hypothetical protein
LAGHQVRHFHGRNDDPLHAVNVATVSTMTPTVS